MAVFRSLVALAYIAFFALSSAPIHVNALADHAQVARHPNHDGMAKRKRADSGTCVPRSSTPASTPAPTTLTPSTTSSSAAPSSTSGVHSKKWGLAWANGDEWLANFANLSNVQFWTPDYPDETKSLGLQPMPMLWGYNQVDEFKQKVVQGYAAYALGPNEVNEPTQANMSPQDAFNVWMGDINYLKDEGYQLVSPSCTDDADGFNWYSQFFALCEADSTCQVDAIAVHCYTTSADHCIQYCNDLHGNFTRDVYITEFANQDFSGAGEQATMDEIWDFAGKMAHFVDTTEWIKGAFPFAALQNLQGVNPLNSLIDPSGNPTELALYYFNSDH